MSKILSNLNFTVFLVLKDEIYQKTLQCKNF